MHILLEDSVPVELGCILYGLSADKPVTVDTVNSAIVTVGENCLSVNLTTASHKSAAGSWHGYFTINEGHSVPCR